MKKGTKVKIVNCLEATQHPATIWTTTSDSWKLGSGEEVIRLAGYRGGFDVRCLQEVEEPHIPEDAIYFADGECPVCGSFCGNGGHGGLKCECGWKQDEKEAEKNMKIAKEIFDSL
jgi:hypothetical protein